MISLIKKLNRKLDRPGIREVNLPCKFLVQKAKESLKSENLEYHEKKTQDGIHIRGISKESFLKILTKRKPVLMDLKIIEIERDRTRIENQLGLTRKTQTYFLTIYIVFSLLFSFLSFDFFSFPTFANYRIFLTISCLLILLSIHFLVEAILENTKKLFDSYMVKIKRIATSKHHLYDEILFQDESSPYTIIRFAFIFIVIYSPNIIASFYRYFTKHGNYQVISSYLLVLLSVFFVTLIVMIMYEGFCERLSFYIMGWVVSFSFLFMTSQPFVFGYAIDLEKLPNSLIIVQSKEAMSLLFSAFMMTLAPFALGVFFFAIGPNFYINHLRRFKQNTCKQVKKDSSIYKCLSGNFPKSIFIMFIVLWIVLNIGCLITFYHILSLFEFALLHQNIFFKNNLENIYYFFVQHFLYNYFPVEKANLITKIFTLLYTIPFLLFVGYLIKKRASTIKPYVSEKVCYELRKRLNDCVTQVSEDLKLKPPSILIDKSPFPFIGATIKGILPKKHILFSAGCTKLSDFQLKALIAHEICHLKYHWRWYCLYIMSKFSLLGTGFLLGSCNTYKMEYEADEYAWKYISYKGGKLEDYQSALMMMSISAGYSEFKSGGLFANRIHTYEKQISFEKSNFIKDWVVGWKSILRLIFGDEVLSYFHPSIEERILYLRNLEYK